MTEQPGGNDDNAEATYLQDRQQLWDNTVASLTAAVQLTHPQHGATDFADFLATALAATAANVGSTERITAGRPGSWESDLLTQLLNGTIGHDAGPEDLARHRTIPVVVQLNVAQLVRDAHLNTPPAQRSALLPELDDALREIDHAAEDEEQAHPAPAGDADAATWEAYTAAADARGERSATAEDALRRRYTAAYQAYADQFAGAVRAAVQGIQGLTVPVEIQAETEPDASWTQDGDTTNPDEWGDTLVWRLWETARERAGLPTLGEPPVGERP